MGLEDGYIYQALRGHGQTGFWESFASHVKASIDWCELNYDMSMYICEFWNTISSFSMVGPHCHCAAVPDLVVSQSASRPASNARSARL